MGDCPIAPAGLRSEREPSYSDPDWSYRTFSNHEIG